MADNKSTPESAEITICAGCGQPIDITEPYRKRGTLTFHDDDTHMVLKPCGSCGD